MGRKYRIRPRFWLMMSLAAAVVFAGTFAVTGHKLSQVERALEQRIDQRDEIVREIGQIEERIAFVQTDEYVERMARDTLGLIKPGEIRYVSSGN